MLRYPKIETNEKITTSVVNYIYQTERLPVNNFFRCKNFSVQIIRTKKVRSTKKEQPFFRSVKRLRFIDEKKKNSSLRYLRISGAGSVRLCQYIFTRFNTYISHSRLYHKSSESLATISSSQNRND